MSDSDFRTENHLRKTLCGHSASMRRFAEMSIRVIAVSCAVGACGTSGGFRGADSRCLSVAGAEVCAEVDRGRLVMTAEGLEAGSVLKIQLENAGPAEWVVSETGTLISDPGSLGFMSYDGTFGRISVEATSDDGTPVLGEIVLD